MSTQLARIAAKARADTRVCFTSLAHVMTEEFLAETWTKLNRKGAAGVDRETIETYALNLDERLRDLQQRLKQGRYRAPPVRAVEIPKSNGKVRMLGIPTVEDRLVQAAVARLLNAVFEPVFLDCSYGFRPGKSAHHALKTLREQIVCKPVMQVYEADIRAFFDRVSHTWLRRMLRQRVADKTLLRLIDKWLQAGVMREGLVSERGEGVPQGGPVSPILSNIYLHYALDLWFEKKVKPAMRGHAAIIRFADDFVACFQYASDVKRFETVLPDAGKRVWFRLLTGADERKLPQLRRNAGDQLLSAMLAFRVLEVEGVEARDKKKFIEDLSLRDADFLVDEFDRVDCGVDTGIEIECPECFATQEVDLPFDRTFFMPGKERAARRRGRTSSFQG